ncbi:MAG TPA: DNA-3-methyladenine glycosylase, partial [Holophaga sp.]|nr:DNA-3-methyladenine glycosylase [Holophaga sp.]
RPGSVPMPGVGGILPKSFYLRPVDAVALDLLGRCLRLGDVVLRITEVEAYGGSEDSASHCRSGRTPRNAPMWEEGGRAYVYLCYGLHHLLNLVTGPEGEGSAVLVRACEPVDGLEIVQARRGAAREPALLAGPGRVAQALGVDLSFSGRPLYLPGGLEVREGTPPAAVLKGPRIGVSYAAAGSAWVTEPRSLAPL